MTIAKKNHVGSTIMVLKIMKSNNSKKFIYIPLKDSIINKVYVNY